MYKGGNKGDGGLEKMKRGERSELYVISSDLCTL
jgi:hypothetical protein